MSTEQEKVERNKELRDMLRTNMVILSQFTEQEERIEAGRRKLKDMNITIIEELDNGV